ncbi:MAG: hypothetical protein R3F43_25740 [bacterium]
MARRASRELAALYGGWFDLPGALRLEDLDRYPVGGSYNTETGGASHRALAALTARVRAGATRLKATAFAQARSLRLDENFTGDLAYPEQGDRHLQEHFAWSGGLRVHGSQPLGAQVSLRAFADAHAHRVDQRIDRLDRDGQPWNHARDLQSTRLASALGLGLAYALGALRALRRRSRGRRAGGRRRSGCAAGLRGDHGPALPPGGPHRDPLGVHEDPGGLWPGHTLPRGVGLLRGRRDPPTAVDHGGSASASPPRPRRRGGGLRHRPRRRAAVRPRRRDQPGAGGRAAAVAWRWTPTTGPTRPCSWKRQLHLDGRPLHHP